MADEPIKPIVTPPPQPPAVPSEPAPAVPPAPEPLKALSNDPLMRAVFKDLRGDVQPAPEPPIVPAPAPAPAVPPDPVMGIPITPPPAPPVAAARKKRVRVVEEDDIPLPPAPAPQPPALEPAHQPPVVEDEAYVQSLTPEQRDELHEAEVAERLFPDRHKGLKKRTIEFYKTFDTDVQRLIQENPTIQLNESNEDFQRLVAKKPKLAGSEARRVQREIGAEEAVERTKREFAPRLSELERDTKANSLRPQIDIIQTNIRDGVAKKLVLNDDKSPLHEAIKALETDPKTAGENYSLELEVLKSETDRAATLAGEYMYLINGAKEPDFSPSKVNGILTDSVHKQLSDIINRQCDVISRSGPEYTIRNGKRFLTRLQFQQVLQSDPKEAASLDPATFETNSYWTMNHSQVLEMLSYNAKSSAEARIKFAETTAAKHGYVRQRKAKIDAPQPIVQSIPPAPAPITPPSRPSAMPGAVAPVVQAPPSGDSMSSRLGLRRGS